MEGFETDERLLPVADIVAVSLGTTSTGVTTGDIPIASTSTCRVPAGTFGIVNRPSAPLRSSATSSITMRAPANGRPAVSVTMPAMMPRADIVLSEARTRKSRRCSQPQQHRNSF